jgi:hypothetical protein
MTKTLQSQSDPAAMDLGRWIGRREAFALVAGRCSAAEAESLRHVRENRQYKQFAPSWEEFCSKRLGVSRRHIDRTLRLLDEFGPAYFHVAQMAHVTADEYRAIAPHVGDDGVHMDNAVIALIPENSEKISAAVAELIRRERPAKEKDAPADAVLKRCEAVAESLSSLDGLDLDQKLSLAASLAHLRKAAAGLGVLMLSV